MAGYTKAQADVFASLVDKLEFAKKNAARALKEALGNHTDNPSTRVHELVEYLQQIKEPK